MAALLEHRVSKNRATIIDVAALAGVSWKTVSRVVNGEDCVRPETSARIRDAIAQLGYQPNAAARSLAGTRSFLIGAITANPSPHYMVALHRGAAEACRTRGYHLALEEVHIGDPALSADFERNLMSAQFDGVFISPPATDSRIILDLLDKHGVRYIRLDPATELDRSDRIVADDESGVAALVRHLWDLGHRKFGLVNGPEAHRAAPVRREAYLAEIARLGGDPSDVGQAQGTFLFKSGFTGGKELLSAQNRPTAIFATNDEMAGGVVAAAGELGLRVPYDVAVAGFDDSDVAGYVWPPLTTIRQPIVDYSRIAVEMLIAPKPEGGHRVIRLPVELVIRKSTMFQ
jgi:LacI family transcriptional regulator